MNCSNRIVTFVFFLCAALTLQAQDENNDGYHDEEVAALKKIISANSGNTLGWDGEDYGSWSGLTWNTSSPARLIKIDISNSRLSGTIDLSACTELDTVDCGDNNIDSLNLRDLTSLRLLDCGYNNLASLDVSTLDSLQTLYCWANNLSRLDLENNSMLTEVYARFNNLQFINCKNGNSNNLYLYNTYVRYGNLFAIQVDDVDNFPNKEYPDDIYSTNWDFPDVELPVIDYNSIVDINSEEPITELATPSLLGDNQDLVTITNDATLPISDIGLTVVTWTFDYGNGIVKTAKQYIAINNPNVVSIVENYEPTSSVPSSYAPCVTLTYYVLNQIQSEFSLGDIVGVESLSDSGFSFDVEGFYTDEYVINASYKYYPSSLPDYLLVSALVNASSKSNYPIVLKIFNADGDSILHIGHIHFLIPDRIAGAQLSNHVVSEDIAIGDTVGILSKLDYTLAQDYWFTMDDNSYFSLDGDRVIVKDTLNFERSDNLPIALTIENDDGSRCSANAYFNIIIEDVNEAPTAVVLSNDTISENLEPGSFVAILEASDEDSDQTFTYSIAENNYFEVSGDSLFSKNVCDFETQNPYYLEITVFDQDGLSYTDSLFIEITDKNEAPTAIALSKNTIAENASTGTEVGTLTATDEDVDQSFTYSLNDNSNFKISGNKLVSNSDLDYEQQSTYPLEITVFDQDSLSYTDSLFIEITDKNEAPTAVALSKNTIAENASTGTEVGTLAATDEDVDQSFTYSLNDNSNFKISGNKLVSNSDLDYELQSAYPLEITVFDQDGLSYTDSLFIEITDKNEAPTAIALSKNTIAENASTGTEVGTLAATDEDVDQSFTYKISENENFELSGDTLISKAVFDFETQEAYQVEITVFDQDSLSYTDSLFIEITDKNEAPTAIALSKNTIAENASTGTEVGTLSATDEDVDQSFTYKISENENFELSGDTLISKAVFDFETQEAYQVEITVFDQDSLSYTDSLFIEITDKNEAPTAIALSKNTIAENASPGTEVGTLTATDEDVDQSFTYSLNDNSNFKISGNKLVSNSDLDYEQQSTYPLEITVFDQDSLSYADSLFIEITDKNEAPTAIALSKNTIAENASTGTEVGTLTATDEDVDQSFTYKISENDNFELSGDTLISKAVFDFETQEAYQVEITVFDQDSLSYTDSLFIEVTDKNEAPTAIALSKNTIAENASTGTEVGTLTATDEDVDQFFTYSLSDNSNFKISGNKLVSNSDLDYERQSAYPLEITVFDQDSLSYTDSLFIEITDENEAPTAIALSKNTIAENASTGTEVGTLTATDEDVDQSFTYSLNDNSNFKISGNKLVSNSYLDYELQSAYPLEITVFDQDGLSYTDSLFIEITDKNEAPTAIALSKNTIAENASTGTEVGTLTTTDEDVDQSFIYSLNDNSNFKISGNKLVSNSDLDYELQSAYPLEITVFDQDGLSYTDSLFIEVTDKNEAPTAIALSKNTIAENASTGTEVGTLTTTDEDVDQFFTYSLSDNSNFKISGNKLVSNSDLDYELQSAYPLEITVRDQDGLSYTESFSIEIKDVNEVPVFISDPVLEAKIGEEYVYDVECEDMDQDGCALSLESTCDWLTFTDYGDGKARLTGVPSEEGSLFVTLKASDSEFTVLQEFEIDVEILTGIKKELLNAEVSVYPNPVVNELHVELSQFYNAGFSCCLRTVNGAELYRKNYQVVAGNCQFSISMQTLSSGVYFLVIESDYYQKSFKIVKQ